MNLIWQYLVTAAIFLAIDAVWLGVVANKLYKKELGDLLLKKPKLLPAGVFYSLYIVAILVFVLRPALEHGSLSYAAGYGALLGLTMYATYDLTNLSTLKRWSPRITVIDLLWGAFVTATASVIGFLIFH